MPPQIPSTFAPDTALTSAPSSSFAAGGVAPMSNAAPGQQEQMGDAVTKTGSVLQSIGARMQWQLDSAAIKSATTSFLQQSQRVLTGDGSAENPGYLNTRGQAAINGFAPASQALAKIQQQGMDGLSDGLQKMIYSRVTTAHLTNFGATMADHHFQQYALNSAQASSDESSVYAQLAVQNAKSIGATDQDGNPTGTFYSASQRAVQAAQQKVLVETGAGPNDPQGIAAAKQVTTQIAQGVISHMLDNHNYQGAQSFYNSELEQGHIDEQTAEMLGRAIKSNTDVETVKDVSNQLITNALRTSTGQPTGINPQLPIKGGSYTLNKNDDGSQTFTVPQGTAVNAAADGKVDSVTQDEPGGPYTVELTHADGSTTQYANLSTVNYKVGDSVMQGQQPIGLTAKGGLDYSMANPDGKAVDPATQVLPAVDLTKFSDPAMAKTVIDQINKTDYSPQMKAQMATYVDVQQKINFRQDAENKQSTIQPLQDAFYQYADAHKASDGSPTFSTSALTPSQWATMDQIDPELSERLRVLAVPGGAKGPPVDGAIDQRAGFILDPTTLTVPAVQAIRSKLTPGTYLSLLAGAQYLQTAGPKGVPDATALATRIKYFASNSGINVDPKTEQDKQNYLDLQYKVQQGIDAIKEQNHGKATPEQVDGVIKSMVTQHTLSLPRSSWNPLSILGISSTYADQKYGYQMPNGATSVVPGSDGKMHYTDGKTDLGVVQ